ncbi:MAG: phosphonate dehydrogenase [Rhodomicrobiaceae bacterium]
MSFKIVVANQIHKSVLGMLENQGHVVINSGSEPWTKEELLFHCSDADALMAFMTESINDEFLEQCPKLKIIAGALKGYNNLDIHACNKRGVAVTIVPDLLTDPTAELTIGLMIAVARNFVPGDVFVRSGDFNGWRPKFYGGSIQGSTIGVLGAGAVGQAILRLLSGFNCKRLYVDKSPLSSDDENQLGVTRSTLNLVQQEADFIILAMHLMPETLHMVDDEFLSHVKKGSYLINPARGSLVDEAAVVKALEQEKLAGYATDTFEMEDWALPARPRIIHQGLLNSDKTVLTPHIGSAVRSVREAIELSAAESIITFSNGNFPNTTVNKKELAITR